MKQRISVTIDGATISALKKLLRSKKYRNQSHAVEAAIDKLLEAEDGKDE